MLHRKGRPSSATSHELRPGKPSFLHPWPSPRGLPRPAEEQITRKTGLGKPLGLYPKYQHKMLHNDVAQQRPGEQPASAPKTSQKSPRAQTPAKFKTPTLKQADSRHEDIDVAGLRDGRKDTTRIIRIHGRHSPPSSGQLTTHATRQMLQHPKGLTTSPQLEPMSVPQPARYHSFGEGHVQARSVF